MYFSSSNISYEELQAQDLVKRGEIDQAISIYEQIQCDSGRILNIIGRLYAERKGDYERAISCYEAVLQIQEEVNISTKIYTLLQFFLSFIAW